MSSQTFQAENLISRCLLTLLAHLYEEATIGTSRDIILQTLADHLPKLQPKMRILDLACGSGSVTRVIYEHCAAHDIQPPQITGVDVGANVADASNMNMLADDTFDVVIMSFGIFAVPDAVADKAAAELYRVLKPGGKTAVTCWRKSWVERMANGAAIAVSRPAGDWRRFNIGKWLKMETTRDTLLAGGFDAGKIQHSTIEYSFRGKNAKDLVDQFSTPFWTGLCTGNWTEEQKGNWTSAVEGLLTQKEKQNAAVRSPIWLFMAEK
jgi:SAM-dependent methyltransferase